MGIRAVKFRTDGFYSQPFAFGGEVGIDKFDNNNRYRKGDFVSPNLQEGLTIVADNSVIRAYFSMSERDLMEYLYQYKTMDATVRNMPEVQLMLSGG